MRVVVITGCSSGFGLRTAVAFARAGDQVVATMRDLAKAGPLEEAAAAASVGLTIVALDVADPASVTAAFHQIEADWGPVDVLVNNAGTSRSGAVELLSDDDWLAVLDANLLGALRCIRAVLPGMRRRGSGAVLNVSSIAGRIPSNPTMSPYNASKCGLGAVSESLAMEVEEFGIRVRCIEPGFFKTGIAANAVHIGGPDSPYTRVEAAMQAFYEDGVAKGGDPDLVAEAIVAAADDPEFWPVHRLVGPDADMLTDAAAAMPEAEWVRMTKTLSGLV